MNNVLIVQPHSDDALLNCYHILNKEDIRKIIITADGNPNRHSEDIHISKMFKNIVTDCCPVIENENSYYLYWAKNTKLDIDSVLMLMVEKYGEGKIDSLTQWLRTTISDYYKKYPDLIVYCPMGCGHPFHLLINYLLEEEVDYFYRDFPHSYKPKRGLDYFKGMRQKYTSVAGMACNNDWFNKRELFKKIKSGQTGHIFSEPTNFNKAYSEEIYRKRIVK